MDDDWDDDQERLIEWREVFEYMHGVSTSRRHRRLKKERDKREREFLKFREKVVQKQKNWELVPSPVAEQSVGEEGVGGLIESPLLDALGHSTNIVIISLFLEKRTSFTRVEILEAAQEHKSAMEMENIEFSMSRVRDGKTTINFWIDHLVSTGVLRRVGMAASFELNEENDFVRHCEDMYSREFSDDTPSILEQHPSKTVVAQ